MTTSSISNIPFDIWRTHIFPLLKVQDLNAVELVCKLWKKYLETNPIHILNDVRNLSGKATLIYESETKIKLIRATSNYFLIRQGNSLKILPLTKLSTAETFDDYICDGSIDKFIFFKKDLHIICLDEATGHKIASGTFADSYPEIEKTVSIRRIFQMQDNSKNFYAITSTGYLIFFSIDPENAHFNDVKIKKIAIDKAFQKIAIQKCVYKNNILSLQGKVSDYITRGEELVRDILISFLFITDKFDDINFEKSVIAFVPLSLDFELHYIDQKKIIVKKPGNNRENEKICLYEKVTDEVASFGITQSLLLPLNTHATLITKDKVYYLSLLSSTLFMSILNINTQETTLISIVSTKETRFKSIIKNDYYFIFSPKIYYIFNFQTEKVESKASGYRLASYLPRNNPDLKIVKTDDRFLLFNTFYTDNHYVDAKKFEKCTITSWEKEPSQLIQFYKIHPIMPNELSKVATIALVVSMILASALFICAATLLKTHSHVAVGLLITEVGFTIPSFLYVCSFLKNLYLKHKSSIKK